MHCVCKFMICQELISGNLKTQDNSERPEFNSRPRHTKDVKLKISSFVLPSLQFGTNELGNWLCGSESIYWCGFGHHMQTHGMMFLWPAFRRPAAIYSETWELGTPNELWKTVLNCEGVLFLRSIAMYWICLGTEVTVLSSQVVPISQVVLTTGFTLLVLVRTSHANQWHDVSVGQHSKTGRRSDQHKTGPVNINVCTPQNTTYISDLVQIYTPCCCRYEADIF